MFCCCGLQNSIEQSFHMASYSREQWVNAVNYGALVGYTLYVGLRASFAVGSGGAAFGAIVFLPFAFVWCWIVAAPLLRIWMRRQMGWLRAVMAGGALASLMSLISIGLGRFYGWLTAPVTGSSTFFSHGGVTSVDGNLTAHRPTCGRCHSGCGAGLTCTG